MRAGVTYDTGALIAAERDERSMWALHAAALDARITPTIPAPVLAQAWRGGARQALLHRLLRLCQVEPLSASQARAVGALAAASGHDDVVDLAVVEGAIRRNDTIVTSDRRHIEPIVRSQGQQLEILDP